MSTRYLLTDTYSATMVGSTARAGLIVGSLHTDVEEMIEGRAALGDDEWPEFDEEAFNEQQAQTGPHICMTAATAAPRLAGRVNARTICDSGASKFGCE